MRAIDWNARLDQKYGMEAARTEATQMGALAAQRNAATAAALLPSQIAASNAEIAMRQAQTAQIAPNAEAERAFNAQRGALLGQQARELDVLTTARDRPTSLRELVQAMESQGISLSEVFKDTLEPSAAQTGSTSLGLPPAMPRVRRGTSLGLL